MSGKRERDLAPCPECGSPVEVRVEPINIVGPGGARSSIPDVEQFVCTNIECQAPSLSPDQAERVIAEIKRRTGH